ncbi:MAG: 3'-5' exonuclease [Bacteroidales bacterium]|nr:3'-5' exonuclease [Bacteroidales bacterium]HOY39115.1 exonuclease domain-containing protein [Bacteroidales bacterium]HQP04770.1 exonuclease domain-containing protein [Bacteroidales bacterium]
MELNLKKPLIFFDIETTGLNIINDRIIEISMIKVLPNGREETKSYRFNPEIPIPEETTAIHGIRDVDVATCPTFKSTAKEIATFIEGCDLAGYNSLKFDIPMLVEEFLRADIEIDLKKHNFVDVQVLFMKKEPRTLSAAYKFYCNKEHSEAHSALGDTLATYEVLKSQLDKYNDLPNDVVKLAEISSYGELADFAGRLIFDEKGREMVNFGKYKGQLLEEVFRKDPGYYSWVMQGDFPLYTKKVFTRVYVRFKSLK